MTDTLSSPRLSVCGDSYSMFDDETLQMSKTWQDSAIRNAEFELKKKPLVRNMSLPSAGYLLGMGQWSAVSCQRRSLDVELESLSK